MKKLRKFFIKKLQIIVPILRLLFVKNNWILRLMRQRSIFVINLNPSINSLSFEKESN